MSAAKFETLDDLPSEIPVFPLNNVLLLPGGLLPLNIFENRYLAMIDEALAGNRLIGMVQPTDPEIVSGDEKTEIFDTGCAGRITSFEETEDGRYIINLTGVCRFNVKEQMETVNGYRRIEPDWKPYQTDLKLESCLDLDRERLKELLGNYFEMQGISCDWEAIDCAHDQKLITCLSMVCPFDSSEKQALLEAGCCRKRAEMFLTMLEMAVRNGHGCCGGGCH